MRYVLILLICLLSGCATTQLVNYLLVTGGVLNTQALLRQIDEQKKLPESK